MSPSSLPPLDELRESLRAAAARDIEAHGSSRWRRWRRRPTRLTVGVLIGVGLAGGAATAASLIAVGTPEPDRAQKADRYRPGAAQRQIAVRARDPDRPLPWGVAIYTAKDGQKCALPGQLRGDTLGMVRAGKFRPYAADTAGPCADLAHLKLLTDQRVIAGRTLVYGRARPNVRRVILGRGRRQDAIVTGPGGAFLFVLDGSVNPSRYRLRTTS
jgi:hypothetical protein